MPALKPPPLGASRTAPLAGRLPGRAPQLLVVIGLSVVGPLLEDVLGGGRGLLTGFLLLTLAPSVLRAQGPRLHPLDPETLVPFSFFLSSGYAPCVTLFSSPDLTLTDMHVRALRVAYAGALACAAVCTYGSSPPSPEMERPVPAADLRVTTLDHAAVMTGLLGVGMIMVFVSSIGLSALLTMSYTETYAAEQGMGVLTSGWLIIMFVCTYLAVRCFTFRRAGRKVPRFLLVALVMLLLVYNWNTFMGRRGPLVYLLAAIGVAAHVNKLTIRRVWFAVGLVAVGFYSFALEGMRAGLGGDAETKLASAQARLELVQNPLVVPELESVWTNLVIVVNDDPPLLEYPGESLGIAVGVLVPRPLWPDRPRTLSERFVQWFAPRTARRGGAYAFNAAAEGYANLGLLGAALEVALMTLLYFRPTAACFQSPRSSLWQACACYVAAYAYYQYRGELASLLKVCFTLGLTIATMFVFQSLLGSIFNRPVAAARARA